MQWKRIRLGTTRLWVSSLALFSGLRIRGLWHRSQTWIGSGIAVAVAQASGCSPDSTPSCRCNPKCCGCSPKKTKKKKKSLIAVKIIGQASLTTFTILVYKIQVNIELFHPQVNLSQLSQQQPKCLTLQNSFLLLYH